MTVNPDSGWLARSQAFLQSRSVIVLLAVSGLLITAAVSNWLSRLESRNASQSFQAEVADRADSLQRELQAGIEGIYTLREMVRYVDSLPSLVFDDVAAAIMARNANILALEWLPLVPEEERARFEASMERYQPDYQITELDSEGRLVPAAPRPLYAPAAFVYPRYTNHRAIGFDMLTLPVRREAMVRARDTATLAASAPVNLRLRARPGTGIVLIVPVFFGQPASLEERQQALRGYVLAVFETAALANRILPARAGHRYLAIEDVTDPDQVQLYFSKGDAEEGPLRSATLPEIGGRRIQITMAPSPEFLRRESSPLPLLTAGLGVLMVLLVCGYLYLLQRRSEVVSRLVDERTHELIQVNEKLAQMSVTDPLTGLANRRAMDDYMDREWARAFREQKPIAAVMVDVDHFKRINDDYGHEAGDSCLKALADELASHFRRSGDLLARFGGEEFAVVMPNTSDQVREKVERFREHMAAFPVPLPDGDRLVMTVSAGVASVVPLDTLTPRDLLRAADAALYRAKRNGRNRVELAQSVEPLEKDDRQDS